MNFSFNEGIGIFKEIWKAGGTYLGRQIIQKPTPKGAVTNWALIPRHHTQYHIPIIFLYITLLNPQPNTVTQS